MGIQNEHIASAFSAATHDKEDEDLCRAVVHGGGDFSSVLREDGLQNFNSVVKSSMGALVVISSA